MKKLLARRLGNTRAISTVRRRITMDPTQVPLKSLVFELSQQNFQQFSCHSDPTNDQTCKMSRLGQQQDFAAFPAKAQKLRGNLIPKLHPHDTQ